MVFIVIVSLTLIAAGIVLARRYFRTQKEGKKLFADTKAVLLFLLPFVIAPVFLCLLVFLVDSIAG